MCNIFRVFFFFTILAIMQFHRHPRIILKCMESKWIKGSKINDHMRDTQLSDRIKISCRSLPSTQIKQIVQYPNPSGKMRS